MDEEERGLVSLVIGYQIRRSRRALRLSQAELAQGIGSQSMISLLESGRQLPAPDVLSLVAGRLGDQVLLAYASMLNSRTWSFDDFAFSNRALLIEVLRTHRGRWLDVHLKVALQLCEHLYTDRLFGNVGEICRLIMSHTSGEVGHTKAYFYYGSTLLFSFQYEAALKWLNLAAEKNELLDERTRGRLYYNLGYVQFEMDIYGTAIWYAKLAVDTFLRINDYPHHAKSLGLLGVIQGRLGRMEDARRTLEQAYEMMDRWNVDEADRVRIAISIADVCEAAGDLLAAEQWCHNVIDCGTITLDSLTESAVHQTLCLVYMGQGQAQRAVEEAGVAMAAAEHTEDGRMMCRAYLLFVSLSEDTGEQVSTALRAYTIAKQFGYLIEQAFSADCLAELLSHNNAVRAEQYRLEALESYRQHFTHGSVFPSVYRYLKFSTVHHM